MMMRVDGLFAGAGERTPESFWTRVWSKYKEHAGIASAILLVIAVFAALFAGIWSESNPARPFAIYIAAGAAGCAFLVYMPRALAEVCAKKQ
jgi:hypothetical protein